MCLALRVETPRVFRSKDDTFKYFTQGHCFTIFKHLGRNGNSSYPWLGVHDHRTLMVAWPLLNGGGTMLSVLAETTRARPIAFARAL
jgi:hypothetical protein